MTIQGPKTELDHPTAVSLGSFGEPVVLNAPPGGHASIVEYESFGNHRPIAWIAPDFAPNRFKDPTAIVATGFDDVWVADAGHDSVSRYGMFPLPKRLTGSIGPAVRIQGSATQLASPSSIALTADGNVVVTDASGGDVIELPGNVPFQSARSSDVAPVRTLETAGGLSGATVYGTSPSAPQHLRIHQHGRSVTLRWSAPKRNGGGLEGYFADTLVASQFGNRGTLKSYSQYEPFTTTTATHVTERKLKPGENYYAVVESVNAYGSSRSATPIAFTVPKE
jgi:hypothetical protein